MKFHLIDKVLAISDDRLTATKRVNADEDYLADHFPTFPVLPGVLMLEALVQAGMWLVHRRRSFDCSMIVLKEARNVKYGQFVRPGDDLQVEVELVRSTPAGALLKGNGTVRGRPAVSARIELACFNLADRDPELAPIDRQLRRRFEARWPLIAPPADAGPLSAP